MLIGAERSSVGRLAVISVRKGKDGRASMCTG